MAFTVCTSPLRNVGINFFSFDFRAIHLPQQPLPIIHTIQSSSSQVKPIQSSGQQLPVMAAGISSIMPKFAATAVHAHQRVTEQQQQQQQQHSNVKVQIRPSNVSLQGATISASILSTSFLPTTCSSMMRNQVQTIEFFSMINHVTTDITHLTSHLNLHLHNDT